MSVYGPWLEKVFDDYLAGKTIKALLVTSSYAQDVDHDFRNDITAEISGTGYTAGGVVVTGFAASYDAAANAVRITCSPINFGNPDIDSIGGVVFYVSTGVATTDAIIVADPFGPVDADGTVGLIYTPHVDGIAVAQIGAGA